MKTVLFYSFKGGVGRTQLLLNVAKYLAREKDKKIVIVDFDIYAPGLSYLSSAKKDENKQYFLKYLVNLFQDEESAIFTETLEKNLDLISIYNMENLIPYNSLLTELSQYLYSIKTESDKRRTEISTAADKIFEVIKDDIERSGDYDYAFFDARTGITEVSDILFSHYVDLKIFMSSYNIQNIEGTNEILRILSEQAIHRHTILRVLSPRPVVHRDELKGIKAKADLDHRIELKNKFEWLGTMEIPYESELVFNDFEVWDKLDDNNKYKQSIRDIANSMLEYFDNAILTINEHYGL
jgi:MinD-like ATPase involved in chromosome partitioning or flagellar assembly